MSVSLTAMIVVLSILGGCAALVAVAKHTERRRSERRHAAHRAQVASDREVPATFGFVERYGETGDGWGGRMGALAAPRAPIVVDPLTEQELLAAQADHGAESLAVDLGKFRTTQDDIADEVWRANFAWYERNVVAPRADALVRATETIGAGALDDFDVEMAAYDEKIKMIIDRFVHGEPEPALAVVTAGASTVFTWSTNSYPTVLSVPPAPVRELLAARIAQDPFPREAPVERFYAMAGFTG